LQASGSCPHFNAPIAPEKNSAATVKKNRRDHPFIMIAEKTTTSFITGWVCSVSDRAGNSRLSWSSRRFDLGSTPQ
jgi:hypothetical protein